MAEEYCLVVKLLSSDHVSSNAGLSLIAMTFLSTEIVDPFRVSSKTGKIKIKFHLVSI